MRDLCMLFIALCSNLSLSLAQPVINATSFTPHPGESFIAILCDNTQPAGSSGSGVTWTYNSITPTSHADTIWYLAADPYGVSDSFTDWNLIKKKTTIGYLYTYLKSNTDSVTIKGYRGSDFSSAQSVYHGDPYSMMRFPLTYTAGWHDSVVQPTCDTTINFHDVVYDGYGTLIVNGETFANVARVKTILIDTATRDCSWGPGSTTPVLSYSDTIYDYYTSGYHYPILTIRYSIHGNTTYFSRRNTLSVPFAGATILSALVPNPSDKNTRITFSLIQPAHCSVSVIDMSGQTLWRHTEIDGKAGNNIYEIATDKLPAGIYTVVLNTGKENYYTRLTVAH